MHPNKNIQKIEQLRCDSDNRTIGHNPQKNIQKPREIEPLITQISRQITILLNFTIYS